jgi:hypothetical protein
MATTTACRGRRFGGTFVVPEPRSSINNVRLALARPDGEVMLVGEFRMPRARASQGRVGAGRCLGLLPSTCPAFVIDRGRGCSSAVGPLLATASEAAWLGGTLRSRCTGLAMPSLAIALHGFAAANTPLAQISPLGAAGCTLLATPDIAALAPAASGIANAALAIPNAAALVGAAFEQQFLAIELDTAGNLLALRSSNALRLVIGAL